MSDESPGALDRLADLGRLSHLDRVLAPRRPEGETPLSTEEWEWLHAERVGLLEKLGFDAEYRPWKWGR